MDRTAGRARRFDGCWRAPGSPPWPCTYPSVGKCPRKIRAPNANAEVARLFAEIGDILEIKGEPPYRYNAYRTAARSVGNATERLDALFEQGRLRELHGVGNALEAKIIEYLTTGRMAAYERRAAIFRSHWRRCCRYRASDRAAPGRCTRSWASRR